MFNAYHCFMVDVTLTQAEIKSITDLIDRFNYGKKAPIVKLVNWKTTQYIIFLNNNEFWSFNTSLIELKLHHLVTRVWLSSPDYRHRLHVKPNHTAYITHSRNTVVYQINNSLDIEIRKGDNTRDVLIEIDTVWFVGASTITKKCWQQWNGLSRMRRDQGWLLNVRDLCAITSVKGFYSFNTAIYIKTKAGIIGTVTKEGITWIWPSYEPDDATLYREALGDYQSFDLGMTNYGSNAINSTTHDKAYDKMERGIISAYQGIKAFL